MGESTAERMRRQDVDTARWLLAEAREDTIMRDRFIEAARKILLSALV